MGIDRVGCLIYVILDLNVLPCTDFLALESCIFWMNTVYVWNFLSFCAQMWFNNDMMSKPLLNKLIMALEAFLIFLVVWIDLIFFMICRFNFSEWRILW